MQMLNPFCHSSLFIMLCLNPHLFFRVAFIFVIFLLSSSASVITFSMGHVLHHASYNVVFISVMAVCLFPTSLLGSDPSCFVFSYYLVISLPSSHTSVEFLSVEGIALRGFFFLFSVVVKYLVTIFFYFVETFFW